MFEITTDIKEYVENESYPYEYVFIIDSTDIWHKNVSYIFKPLILTLEYLKMSFGVYAIKPRVIS